MSAPVDVTVDATSLDSAPIEARRRRRLREFATNPLAIVALVFLVALTAAALTADFIAPYGEAEADLRNRFATPLSSGHLLGSDDVGRDLLTRLLYGARVSLTVGVGSIGVALAVAIPSGLWAAARPGRIDTIVTWVVDVVLSIPPLILVFAMAGILGSGLSTIVIALGVYFTPLFFRLVRSEARSVMATSMVMSSRAIGLSDGTILFRHVLPNVSAPLIIEASLAVGVAITGEASLSFIGLGVQPPTASWGVMLTLAFTNITQYPWMVFVPGAALGLTVLAINLVGDALRDSLGRVES